MASKYPEEDESQSGQESHHNIQHLSGFLDGGESVSECEVVFEAEGDLLTTRHENCPKNPGHPSFIPVSQFSMEHLPTELRTQENMDLIQRKIDQTVKIRVAYTSLNRPNVFSDSKAPYPYARFKGSKKAVRYGTGGIHRLLSRQPIRDKSCPCHFCVSSGNPEKEYWLITVRTATHVIYDDSEAELATFDCFFDSDEAENVQTLYGICIDGTNTSQSSMYKSDVVEVVCVAHDNGVVDRIFNTMSPDALHIPHAYTSELPPEGVIVSHPHGCSKRITFGNINYLKVPVKPIYEVDTPISFLDGTKCRFKSCGEGAESENSSSLASFLLDRDISCKKMDNPQGNSYDEACLDNVARTNHRLSQNTLSTSTTPRNATLESPGHLEENKDDVLGKTRENSPSKTLTQACSEFCNEFMTHLPHSTEFNQISSDTGAVADALRSIQDENVPNHLIGIKAYNKMLQSMNTTTHTSKQCSDKEVDVKDISSYNQETVDILTETFIARGISEDKIISALDVLKESLPNLLDPTLPQEQHRSGWSELFGTIFKQSFENRMEQLQSSEDKVNVHDDAAPTPNNIDDNVLTCENNEGSNNPDDSISDMLETMMEETLGGLDDGTRSTLETMGLGSIVHNFVKIFDESPEPRNHPDQDDGFEVSSGVKFLLPSGADYAMRFYKESPGWFVLPPGTKVINAQGNTMSLTEGVEFRNSTFFPEHSSIAYDTDTCPGSSGAAVYCNLLGNKSMTYFPHSGSARNCNLSGLQENRLFPMPGNIMQGITQALRQFTDFSGLLNNLSFSNGGDNGVQKSPKSDQMVDIELD